MRTFLAILFGILVALAAQAAIDMIANTLYPAAITDMWDRRQVAEAFADRPMPALLLSVLGFFLGGLAGGWAARYVSRRGWPTWVPPGLLALMALVIAFSFPMPNWTLFAMLAAPLIGGLIARHLGRGVAPAEAETPESPADA